MFFPIRNLSKGQRAISNFIVCFALALSALIGSTFALADIASGNPRFTWKSPPNDQNGNPIPATGAGAITVFELYCDGDNTTAKRTFAATVLVWQSAVGAFNPGVHTCYMMAKNTLGKSIGKGVEVTFTIGPPPPPPPVAPGDVVDLKVI